MYTKNSKPELLAPAGNMDAFLAALLAGADAIYVGLGSLNARRNAQNFTPDILADACRMAHLAHRRVYLTANTLVLDNEFASALELIATAWRCGVDAVIVQDIGLMHAITQRYPEIEIHTSTQMSICNKEGVLLAKELGATRVTLAREVSLTELADLAQCGVDLEVFAHGALCVCYSGQCLMSSLIGRRSANRGLCAQPCRLAWELIDERLNKVHSTYEQAGEHLLSPKDLCTIDILPELISTGVASLKIEGRMKSADYVATVVAVYRAALDRAYADPVSYAPTPEEKGKLAEAFSRGFTTAYLTEERGNAMMGYQRPNNRGVQVGRIAALKDGLVEISCEKPLRVGDTLEYWTSRGRYAQEIEALIVGGKSVSQCAAGDRAHMIVRRPVAPGDRVFRVRNEEMAEQASELYSNIHGVPTPLKVSVIARLGEPLRITVVDEAGNQGEASGDVCEPARTKAITRADVEGHVGRFGNTPYDAACWDIVLDEGIGMGFSALHNVRRAALDDYEENILAPWSSRAIREGLSSYVVPRSIQKTRVAQLAVLVTREAEATLARDLGATVVYGLALDMLEWKEVSGVIAVMPTIAHDDELAELIVLAKRTGAAVADSISLARMLVREGVVVEAGQRANAMNAESFGVLENLGVDSVWLSPELSLAQIRDLSHETALPLTVSVFGAQELMITEHCELMSMGPCAQNCATCERRKAVYALRDKKGYEFPLQTDIHGRGHVYNAVELDLVPSIPELRASGVSRFVIDATLLDEAQLKSQIARAKAALKVEAGYGNAPFAKLENTTTGHMFRGVL